MRAKDAHRQQKRHAKLANRARKERSRAKQDIEPTPYSGRKYQTERWVPYVYQTELAIYETVQLSDRRLTNDQVRQSLVSLIRQLGGGLPPALGEAEPEVSFASGHEVDFLIANIRRHWRELFQEHPPASRSDLVGILRTLLHSIEAHAWNTGPRRGYVDFLESFVGAM